VGWIIQTYELNSFGRIYTDVHGPIRYYDEYGAYTQIIKKLMDDRLKFTGSIRYDKAQISRVLFTKNSCGVSSAGQNKTIILEVVSNRF
jgi:outer membrane receptor protein involved in Fe transport